MGKRLYADIEIRGRVFATAAEAAAHFGVTPESIWTARRRGTLHRVGTGAVGAEPCPVRIRGTLYPSARAAARALGVTPGAIHQALNDGRQDSVGLGPRCPNPHRARPVVLGGVRFSSMAAADRALGFEPGYIAHAIRRKRVAARERILAAAMAYAAKAARRAA